MQRLPSCGRWTSLRPAAGLPETSFTHPHLHSSRPPLSSRHPRLSARLASTRPHPSIATPRAELASILSRIPSTAVSQSRLQLALSGLHQPAGRESIRIGILSLPDPDAQQAARHLLRALLADPLAPRQPWEDQILRHTGQTPLLVRFRSTEKNTTDDTTTNKNTHDASHILSLSRKELLEEVYVSSTPWADANLKILLTTIDPFSSSSSPSPSSSSSSSSSSSPIPPSQLSSSSSETLLNLPVDIPIDTERVGTVMTPIHKAILVATGFQGLAKIAALPRDIRHDAITAAIQLPLQAVALDIGKTAGTTQETSQQDPGFHMVDTVTATTGLDQLRNDLGKAVAFEEAWSVSRLDGLLAWIRKGSAVQESTKPAVKHLIASILDDISSGSISSGRSLSNGSQTSRSSSGPSAPSRNTHTDHSTSTTQAQWIQSWSEDAYRELDQAADTDLPSSQAWHSLQWWKLFWRVDDVGHLARDLVHQYFLPRTTRNLIFLAGRLAATPTSRHQSSTLDTTATTLLSSHSPTSPTVTLKSSLTPASTSIPSNPTSPTHPWPQQLVETKRRFLDETIPSLHALAQQLLLRTISTTSLTSALAALLYVSETVSSIFEASSVVALGLVWSLRAMQTKWEKARSYWHDDFREEGRKAIRHTERGLQETAGLVPVGLATDPSVTGPVEVTNGVTNTRSRQQTILDAIRKEEEEEVRNVQALVARARNLLEKV